MPTRYMESAYKVGQKIGGLGGAGARETAKTWMYKQLISKELAYQNKMKEELVKSGIGWSREKDGSLMANNLQMMGSLSPTEQAISQGAFVENELEAYRKRLEITSKSTTIANNIISKINEATKEDNILIKKSMLNNLEYIYAKTIPQTWQSIKGTEYLDAIRKGANAKKTIDGMRLHMLTVNKELYMKSRSTDNLHDYTLVYNQDPDLASKTGFQNPDALEKQFISEETQRINTQIKERELQRQQQFDIAKETRGELRDIAKGKREETIPKTLEIKSQTLHDQFEKALARSFKLDLEQFDTWGVNQQVEYNSAKNIGLSVMREYPVQELNIKSIKNIESFAYAHRSIKGKLNPLITDITTEKTELRVDTKTGQIFKVENGIKSRWIFGKWQKLQK